MTNKKLQAKRLLIFLFFAFALSWIPAIIFNETIGYHNWFETYKVPVTFWIVGFGPALANIITRKLTHEDWHDSMLHLNFKSSWKYYLAALFLIVFISIIQGILTTIVYGNNDWSDFGKYYNWKQVTSSVLMIFATAPLMAFNTFGEEFGWRGYMNQKLEPLIGTTGAVIVGGIIWGLWHAELTVEGHNFGTDYPGFPYIGILAMCIICTFEGILLMWVTKKSGSIYPAAIMHAMINFGGNNIGNFFICGIPEDFNPTMSQWFVMNIPTYVISIAILIIMLMDNKNKKTA